MEKMVSKPDYIGIVHPMNYMLLLRDMQLNHYGPYCFVHIAIISQTEADYRGWGINGYEV